MSNLKWFANNYVVEVKHDYYEIMELCKLNAGKQLDNYIMIPEKNIINFMREFTDYNTNITPEAEQKYTEYLNSIYDIVKFNNRISRNFFYKVTPREIQYNAVLKGINQNVLGIFFQQGLGKTLTAITIFRFLYLKKRSNRLLVIAPSSAIYVWESEFLKYSEFKKEDITIINTKIKEHRNIQNITNPIIIMTYDSYKILTCFQCEKYQKGVRRQLKLRKKYNDFVKEGRSKNDPVLEELRIKIKASLPHCSRCKRPVLKDYLEKDTWTLVVDECHRVGNRNSKQTKLLINNAPYFKFRYLLSGTPVTKSPLQLWSLAQILSKFILPLSFSDFEFSIVSEKGGYNNKQILSFSRVRITKLIKETLSPYIIRALKKDWLDIPEKTIQYLKYSLKDMEYNNIYIQAIKDNISQIYETKKTKFSLNEMRPYLLSLLRVLSAPVKENPRWIIVDDLLLDLIQGQDEDVVLWSYQPKVLDYMYNKYLTKYNPIIIHGNNPSSDKENERNNRIEKFKKDSECKLALLSTLVMDTGITIINTKNMIFLDITMNTNRHIQAEDRNHRIGQTGFTNNYYLEAVETVDEIASFILERDRVLDKELFINPDKAILTKFKDIMKLKNEIELTF